MAMASITTTSRRNFVVFVDKYENGSGTGQGRTGEATGHKDTKVPRKCNESVIRRMNTAHTIHAHINMYKCVCVYLCISFVCDARSCFNPPDSAKLFDTRLGNGNWGKWEFGTVTGTGMRRGKRVPGTATWQPAMRRCCCLWPHTPHQQRQQQQQQQHLPLRASNQTVSHRKYPPPPVDGLRFSGFFQLIFFCWFFLCVATQRASRCMK